MRIGTLSFAALVLGSSPWNSQASTFMQLMFGFFLGIGMLMAGIQDFLEIKNKADR